MVHLSRRVRGRFQAAASFLPAFVLAVSAEPDITASAGESPPRPVIVSAEFVLVDPSTATVPWRVELSADGVRTMVFGDITHIAMRRDTVKYAHGPGDQPGPTPEAAGPGWSCNVHDLQFDTLRDGRYLRSAYQVDCQGVDRHRVDWQFERSSWRGYQNYTHPFIGGWVSDVTNAQTVYADCGPGGSYDYRLGYNSVVVYQGRDEGKSPTAYSNKTKSTCGTGVS